MSIFSANTLRNKQTVSCTEASSFSEAAKCFAIKLFGDGHTAERVTGDRNGEGLFRALAWNSKFGWFDEVGHCYYVTRLAV